MGECLEIGVESWLLEPVPLAETAHRREGKRDGLGRETGEKEVNSSVDWKVCKRGLNLFPWLWRKVFPELWPHLASV